VDQGGGCGEEVMLDQAGGPLREIEVTVQPRWTAAAQIREPGGGRVSGLFCCMLMIIESIYRETHYRHRRRASSSSFKAVIRGEGGCLEVLGVKRYVKQASSSKSD